MFRDIEIEKRTRFRLALWQMNKGNKNNQSLITGITKNQTEQSRLLVRLGKAV